MYPFSKHFVVSNEWSSGLSWSWCVAPPIVLGDFGKGNPVAWFILVIKTFKIPFAVNYSKERTVQSVKKLLLGKGEMAQWVRALVMQT